ncbi:MAG: GxxExxY protein [Bacteroidetes bacterium]|nr:GxxExxY protein [Bacteroidota bacterium]
MPNENPAYKHSEITSKILAAAFEVHKIIVSGFQELIYQRALGIEFEKRQILYHMESELPIIYKNQKVGLRNVDFLIENVVVVEIKATSKLENVHLAQAINYLEAFNIDIGLLINFGALRLEYKRIIHPKLLRNKT